MIRSIVPLILLLLTASLAVAAPPGVPVVGPGTQQQPPPPAPTGLEIPGFAVPDYFRNETARPLELAGTSAIRGVVKDVEHDRPVPDAMVVLLTVGDWHSSKRLSPVMSTYSNGDGSFAFEAIPAGEYLVEACHPVADLVPWDFGDEKDYFLTLGEDDERQDLDVFVYGGHRLRVHLKGHDRSKDEAASQSRQQTFNVLAARRYVVRSNTYLPGGSRFGRNPDEGLSDLIELRGLHGREVTLHFGRGPYWVRGADNQRMNSMPLALKPEELEVELELDLQPAPIVEGQITFADGRAKRGGTARWNPQQPISPLRPEDYPFVPIDGEGRFAVEIPGRGDGHLSLELDDFGLVHLGYLNLEKQMPERFDIEIPKPATITVTVMDPDDNPVPNAKAVVTALGYWTGYTPPPEYWTSQLWFLPPQPEPDAIQRFRTPDPKLSFEAFTDEDGVANFNRLSAGEFHVHAEGQPDSGIADSRQHAVKVAFGEETSVSVTLTGFQPFAGIVRNLEGDPAAGARILLGQSGPMDPPTQETYTDNDGRFRFNQVSQRDTRRVRIVFPDRPRTFHDAGQWTPGREDAVLVPNPGGAWEVYSSP